MIGNSSLNQEFQPNLIAEGHAKSRPSKNPMSPKRFSRGQNIHNATQQILSSGPDGKAFIAVNQKQLEITVYTTDTEDNNPIQDTV